MSECYIYDLITNYKRVKRFESFHLEEERTIIAFLMQIGDKKEDMLSNFKEMLDLNKKITIKKAEDVYKNSKIKNNRSKEIREYEKLKRKIKKYIKRIDLTSNRAIVNSFESLILYEEIIRKLYIDRAQNIINYN